MSKQIFAHLKIKKLSKIAESNTNTSAMHDEYKKLQAELKEIQTIKNNSDQSLDNQSKNYKER